MTLYPQALLMSLFRPSCRKSGLTALAGTNDFGSITSKMLDPSSCSKEDARASTLAYKVYTDRLLCYLTFYLSKLFETEGIDGVDGLVFSGGIGEKSVFLRKDVSQRLGWIGLKVDDKLNEQASVGKEVAFKISDSTSKLPIWVVQTDEEEVCAKMVQEFFDL
jgi:acetate kinase